MGESLKRLGTTRESMARLARKAEEAERVIGIHGVSVTAGTPVGPSSTADRDDRAGMNVNEPPSPMLL
jgi:hypothetical protein